MPKATVKATQAPASVALRFSSSHRGFPKKQNLYCKH